VGSPDDLLLRLQELAQLDLGDFMTFEIEPDLHHPEIQHEGMRDEGLRFRAESQIEPTSRVERVREQLRERRADHVEVGGGLARQARPRVHGSPLPRRDVRRSAGRAAP
jgi:hypothetical protein